MAKDYGQLWKDAFSASNEAQAIQTLSDILASKEGGDFISRLDSQDAELCVEVLDNGVTEHSLKPIKKRVFFIVLRRLAERHGLLPDRIRIKEKIELSDEMLGSGGVADVELGTYEGRPVAVKITRISAKDNFVRIRKQFYKGVVLWSALSHPNILGLIGAQEDTEKRRLVTVSELMVHGDIMKYIDENHANRLELLHGAAKGLEYLHGANLAHGDIKGSNILVSNDTPPRACLADFDFIATVPDPIQNLSTSAQVGGGTPHFKSPERLVPDAYGKKDAPPTQEADIYAFGLVILQVLTGEAPFRDVHVPALGYFVLLGMRPAKPENASAIGLSDSLWDLTQRCWDGEVELRPKVGEVMAHLGEAAAGWDGLMPPFGQVESVASYPDETSESTKRDYVMFLASEPPDKTSQEVVAWPPEEPQPEESPDPPLFQLLWKSLGNYVRKILGILGSWR